MDIEQTDAINDSTRASADLPIKRAPAVRKHAWPSMSEDEIYLRINVPDGLESNGKWPTTYGIVQNAHPNPSESVIEHNEDAPGPPKPKAPGADYAETLSDKYDTKKDSTVHGGYGDEARDAFQHNTGYSGWKQPSSIMHNDNSNDGGVSAKLASARAALSNANNSNVSARPAPVVKRAKAPVQATPISGPSLSDELAAKRKNVDDYAGSN